MRLNHLYVSVLAALFLTLSVGNEGQLINVTLVNQTNNTSTPSHVSPEDQQMYIYCATGIVAFDVMVIIVSVISMQLCKGKSHRVMQTESQYTATLMERPLPYANLPLTRGGRSAATPSWPSTLKNPPYCESTPPEDGGRQRNPAAAAAEGGSLVYVDVDHQLQPGATAPSRMPAGETSEYATIQFS